MLQGLINFIARFVNLTTNSVKSTIQVAGVDASSTVPLPVTSSSTSISGTQTRPDNTTPYSINDVVGTDAATNGTLANIAPVAGGAILINSIGLRIDAAAIPSGMGNYAIHLFNAAPTAIADNAAWVLADADRAKYLGAITLNTPVDVGGTLWSQTDGINKKVQCAAASRTLYYQLQTLAAYTPTALVVKTVTVDALGV
jgi:hypothetical protein